MNVRSSERHESLARVFHALGDSTRLELLTQLRHEGKCVCDLVNALHLGQSLISFHLKVLRDAGLITYRRAGRWVHYSVVPGAMAEVMALLASGHETARESASPRGPQ